MIMMLRWISEHCRSKSIDDDLRKYVLFIDDDYYLNLDVLLTYVQQIDRRPDATRHERETFVTGHVYVDSRPRRFLNDRWYISIDDYPYDRYPPYVTAGCFLMTRSSAPLFYLASKYLPLFRFDDIYVGLLAYAMSIRLIDNNRLFSSYGSSSVTSNGSVRRGFLADWKQWWNNEPTDSDASRVKPICVHGYRGEALARLWNQLHRTNFTVIDT
jgi:hypothetical protein